MKRWRPVLLSVALLAPAAGWVSCNGSGSPGTPGGTDAASDVVVDTTEELPPGECDPCFQVCPCTVGDTTFITGSCMTYTCQTGTWTFDCLGLGCPEASEEAGEDTGPDAMPDVATDGATDATSDVATDATSDVATDATSD